jgi:hypothetical protein
MRAANDNQLAMATRLYRCGANELAAPSRFSDRYPTD